MTQKLQTLREVRSNPPFRPSSEAYAQMDRSMAASRKASNPATNGGHSVDTAVKSAIAAKARK